MVSTWGRVKQNLQRERLLFLSNVFVMTITFLLLGIFITVVVMTQSFVKNLEQQAQVTLFFKDDFPEAKILELRNQITSDDRVLEVKYISKNDAFDLFKEINKNEPVLLESISPEILPASLEVRTKDIDDLTPLSEEYQTYDGIEEIKFFKDVIDRFRYWSNVIYLGGLALVLIFFTISYTVVLVTLRTVINSKGRELEIMKLVGASDNYVKRPLIFQGLFLSGISSLIAGSVFVLFSAVVQFTGFYTGGLSLAFLSGFNISPVVYTLVLAFCILVSGLSLGYIGSWSAIKRYLNY